MSIPTAGVRTSRTQSRGEDWKTCQGARRQGPSHHWWGPPQDNRADVGDPIVWEVVGGSDGPSSCLDWLSACLMLPYPHLPLPAHRGEDGVQWYGERLFMRGHAFGGRKEALAPP